MKKIIILGLVTLLFVAFMACDDEEDENSKCGYDISLTIWGDDTFKPLGSSGDDFSLTFVEYEITYSNNTCSGIDDSDPNSSSYFDRVSRSGDVLSIFDDSDNISLDINLSGNSIGENTINNDNDACGNTLKDFSGTIDYDLNKITIKYSLEVTNKNNCAVF